MRMSPFFIAVLLQRKFCLWLFYEEKAATFVAPSIQTLVDQFGVNSYPLTRSSDFFCLRGLVDFQGRDIWSWIRMIIDGVNALLIHLSDPRNSLETSELISLEQQVTTLAAVNLLLADLKALTSDTSPHTRIKLSFAGLDKLANMRIRDAQRAETEEAKRLCSAGQKARLTNIFNQQVSLYNKTFGQKVVMLLEAFDETHKHLSSEMSAVESNEEKRLERLRAFCNLYHGPFGRNRFEHLFMKSPSTVPDSLPALLFLNVLGFLLDPKIFLSK